MGLRKTIFGRLKTAAIFNTEIGGVSSTINSPTLLASKLSISSSRIENFTIIGSDIKFNVTGGSYNIPNSAFYNDSNISYYYDNSGLVSSVLYSAFANCVALYAVMFPNASTFEGGGYADAGAFKGCVSLTSVTSPNLTNMGVYCFSGCSLLDNINLPLITSIPNFAFNLNSNLELAIFGNVTSLGVSAFNSCSKLLYFNTSYINIIRNSAFKGCALLNNIVNLNSATSIENNAFDGCTSLTGTISANSVTWINYQAFLNCSNVVTYNFPELLTLGSGGSLTQTFRNNSSLEIFLAPKLSSMATTGNDNIFNNIKLGATITVKSNLATINGGSPDGDLQYAISSRGATVIYI